MAAVVPDTWFISPRNVASSSPPFSRMTASLAEPDSAFRKERRERVVLQQVAAHKRTHDADRRCRSSEFLLNATEL